VAREALAEGVAHGLRPVVGSDLREDPVDATHGGAQSVANFSIKYQITSSAEWTTALIFMALAEVLSRLITIRTRARLLTSTSRALPAAEVEA
jgi:hypothetical protein